jgi:hypothetical protein
MTIKILTPKKSNRQDENGPACPWLVAIPDEPRQ